MFGFDYPPRDWAACNGTLLAIAQNQALFSILGTTYGGNGTTTFALPDFRGRTPVHWGNSTVLGEVGGESAHTLQQTEIPAHTHTLNASAGTPDTGQATGYLTTVSDSLYDPNPNGVMVSTNPAGGSQPHNNMQPYLAINFCIATAGIFPSRN